MSDPYLQELESFVRSCTESDGALDPRLPLAADLRGLQESFPGLVRDIRWRFIRDQVVPSWRRLIRRARRPHPPTQHSTEEIDP